MGSKRGARVYPRDPGGDWGKVPSEVLFFRQRRFSWGNEDRAHDLARRMARETGWPFTVEIRGAAGGSWTTYHPDGSVERRMY